MYLLDLRPLLLVPLDHSPPAPLESPPADSELLLFKLAHYFSFHFHSIKCSSFLRLVHGNQRLRRKEGSTTSLRVPHFSFLAALFTFKRQSKSVPANGQSKCKAGCDQQHNGQKREKTKSPLPTPPAFLPCFPTLDPPPTTATQGTDGNIKVSASEPIRDTAFRQLRRTKATHATRESDYGIHARAK